MPISTILALIKDALIIAAVWLVAYFLITYGKNLVKVADMQAVQKQLQANADTVARWQKEATNANAKRDADLAQVASTINAQRTPIIVRVPTGGSAMPSAPTQTGGTSASGGGTDSGGRVDYRPIVNAFELKYETALADCRAAIDQWPQ